MSDIASTISNELTAQLPALNFEGEIIVVDREEQIVAACEDLASYRFIGFDTETRPSFKAGVSYKVSLLQLSTPLRCYLFRLNKIPLGREILRLLESESVIKLGADVAGDIRSLNELRHFKDRGFLDLQSMIWEWGIEEKSLRKMSALTLGYRISKAQRLSNWEAVNLTQQQQGYAATDAWACIEIYNKLQQMTKLSPSEIARLNKERKAAAAAAAEKRAARKAARAAEWSAYKRSQKPKQVEHSEQPAPQPIEAQTQEQREQPKPKKRIYKRRRPAVKRSDVVGEVKKLTE